MNTFFEIFDGFENKLTRKYSAWTVQSQDWNLKRLVGILTHGGRCFLIWQYAENLTLPCIKFVF